MVGQKRTINEADTETENVDPEQSNKKQRNSMKRTQPFGETKTDETMPTRAVNKRFQRQILDELDEDLLRKKAIDLPKKKSKSSIPKN